MVNGTKRDLPNPTYMCVVEMTSRGQYITRKNALRGRIRISEQGRLRRKPYKKKKKTKLVTRRK